MTRVLVVDDHELFRAGVRAQLEPRVEIAGEAATVDVYAEATDEGIQVYVRDRGPGFDPSRIDPDRRGVRESIVGRMKRHGGHAAITSSVGGGTEVELTLPAREQ